MHGLCCPETRVSRTDRLNLIHRDYQGSLPIIILDK